MNVTIEIQANNIGAKRTNLRSTLVVSSLISNIKDKYNLDGTFELRIKGTRQPLNPAAALDQLGINEGSVLVCTQLMEATGTIDAIRRGVRERLSKKFRRVYIVEERNRIESDILWQPAIIGRKDRSNPSNNRLLVVDLEDAEDSPSVSRHHACITEKDGTFYIESINDRNLTILSGTKIRPGLKHPLRPGAVIQAGNVALTFHIIS
jgi:hypothetical protein